MPHPPNVTQSFRSAMLSLFEAEQSLASVRAHMECAEGNIPDLPFTVTVEEISAFRDLAAEAKYYADRWPKQMPTLLKRLAEMCPEGREWKPTEGE